jgi:hypothetical protein
MRVLSFLVLVTSLAQAAIAQSLSDNLPSCAQDCYDSAFGDAGCDTSDAGCVCGLNKISLITSATMCLVGKCSVREMNSAFPRSSSIQLMDLKLTKDLNRRERCLQRLLRRCRDQQGTTDNDQQTEEHRHGEGYCDDCNQANDVFNNIHIFPRHFNLLIDLFNIRDFLDHIEHPFLDSYPYHSPCGSRPTQHNLILNPYIHRKRPARLKYSHSHNRPLNRRQSRPRNRHRLRRRLRPPRNILLLAEETIQERPVRARERKHVCDPSRGRVRGSAVAGRAGTTAGRCACYGGGVCADETQCCEPVCGIRADAASLGEGEGEGIAARDATGTVLSADAAGEAVDAATEAG